MNLDLSIHRMAVAETDSLLLRQVLVARKRSELDLQMLLREVNAGKPADGTDLERALTEKQDQSAALAEDAGRIIDKRA